MVKGTPKEGKKVFLTPEQKEKQMNAAKKIGELTAQIKALLPEFEGKSANVAFTNSVINLEKKVEQFSKAGGERFPLSDEEKELILKNREGKLIIKEKK